MSERLGGRLPRISGLSNKPLVIGVVVALASLTATTSERVRDVSDLFSMGSAEAQSAPRSARPPARSAPAEDFEKRRIAEVEEAFENFAQKVLAGLDRHVSSEKIREDIRKIIALFRDNRASGSCNFGYEFDPRMANISRFHGGPTRTIYLRDDFDLGDIGTLSSLSHELKHVDHDNEMRRAVPEERYRAFFNVRDPRGDGSVFVAVPSHEAEAIALQLEMLNVAMEGRLKSEVVKGREPRIPVKDPDLKKILVWAAGIYFVDPEGFADIIKSRYVQMDGVVLFTPDLIRIN